MLNIVRGDLKNKPVASRQLGEYFESIKEDYEGTLYIGYPIIGTAIGGFKIDALLITIEKGLHLIHIVEGINIPSDFEDIQDEYFTKMQSKLFQYKELTNRRSLILDVNVITYAPATSEKIKYEEGYPCLNSRESLNEYFVNSQPIEIEDYENLLSVLQSITTIRKGTSREYVKNKNSKGAKLKLLEDSIANLDQQQSVAVIETVEGVQRIRGLAGSGKTIVLALKVAYLHAKNPEWKIAVTFNTRSLKEMFKKFIRIFTYEHISEEPNWENINVIHAWGTPNIDGIYYSLCKEHDIEYFDFQGAKSLTSIYEKTFDAVCQKALNEIHTFYEKYDLIVIDEAQDFSKEFLQICYKLLKKPKRLIYAYDELQSLNEKSMESPEIIFGNDTSEKPLVNLTNTEGRPKEDIILHKCYRNSAEVLTTAHALGFGIYRKELVQMFDNKNLWEEIGYKCTPEEIIEGEEVELRRTSESSPKFLTNQIGKDDLISFNSFESNEEQVNYVVSAIEKNITVDELKPEDIIVINANPLTTKRVVGLFRQKLFEKGINSNIAGVSTSPDIFF